MAVAGDGEEALERAGELRPDLVLLDVMMPRIDGFEVAQRLRKNPQTANTSIIMLTAKALSADKVTGLQSGADDYIIKPFDPIELLARVKGTLRRAKEMRNLSPLTGLPGNIRIQEEIERQVREGRPFAVLYCDLDNFKTYNDQKGFVRGDRLIQATARIIQDAVVEFDGAEGFVGHVGGDDFVAVVSPEVAEQVARRDLREVRREPRRSSTSRGPRARLRPDGGPQGRDAGHPARGRLDRHRQQSQAAPVRPLRRGRRRRHRDEAVREARAAAPATRSTAAPRDAPRALASFEPRPLYLGPTNEPVSGAGCNSPPAVTVRNPAAASRGWTRCNSGTDRDSRDGRRRA